MAKHQRMRTTLTLDADVAAALEAACKKTGQPLKRVVNELIRKGLASKGQPHAPPPRLRTKRMGLRSAYRGLKASELLDVLDERIPK